MQNTQTKINNRKKANKNLKVQIENFLLNCEVVSNLRPRTIETYSSVLNLLKNFLEAQGHCLKVDKITEDDLLLYIRHLKKETKLTQETINSRIGHIKPFFNYLFKEKKLIDCNPAEVLKLGKTDKKPIKPFTNKQMDLILKQPDKSTYVGFRSVVIMLLLMSTGIRISELVGIKLEDFDFEDGSVLLRKTKNRIPRVVGIPIKVVKEIKKFQVNYLPELESKDYFFQNFNGTQMKPRRIQFLISSYGKDAGIDKEVRCSPHTFRNYFAIEHLKNGGSTASLRNILGHTSIETVEKYLYWADADTIDETIKHNPANNIDYFN